MECADEEWVAIEQSLDEMDICYARTLIPSLYRIDPGLQHFEDALSDGIRGEGEILQTQLERFHFTSTRPQPRLPRHLLNNCSDINQVWHATRRGHLWSSNPIPILLHVCRESRSTMQRAGYELSFRHRTSGPRTWFNSRRDILYLSRNSFQDDDDYPSGSLDQGHWKIGQLSPDDLMRVQKLDLGEVYSIPNDAVSHAIRLFGNLKEILLVKHHRPVEKEVSLDSDSAVKDGTDRLGHVETMDDLWQALDYTVADIVSARWKPLEARLLQDLRQYLAENNGVEDNVWVWMSCKQETIFRREMVLSIGSSSIPPWSIPKVINVEIVTKAQAEEILQYREEYAVKNPK